MVAVLTRNEAERLPGCLGSLPPDLPVTVVDSGSVDETVDIAEALGARVLFNPWPGFASQRNFCLDACRDQADWVLFVDADERFPPAFFAWLDDLLAAPVDFDVVQVPSILFWEGRPLRHAPGYPIHHPRLVRSSTVRFGPNGTGHGETVVGPYRHRICPVPYEHYFFDGDLDAWMRKHVGLSRLEVEAEGVDLEGHVTDRAALNRRAGHGLWRIPGRFFYHFIWRGGFRDGRDGFAYALVYAWYEATKWTMRRTRRRP